MASPAAALDAQIDVNQQSGVAPLAVFFDGRATSDPGLSATQDFLDAGYEWDFGDAACEATNDVWIHSGKSKCRDLGPVAGHVFETPGTYTTTLVVQHGGQVDTQQIQITVDDPDVVFAGSKTTCVSTSGDFSDPNGVCDNATQVTSGGSFHSLLANYASSGNRLLLRRGESWSNSGSWQTTGAGDVVVGAYGTGAKPVINTGSQKMVTFGGNNNGLRMMDLDVRGNGDRSDGSFWYASSSGQGKNSLALRVDLRDLAKPILLGVNGGPAPLTGYMNNGLAVVESSSKSRAADSGNNDFFGGGERLLFMGNDFGPGDGTEHTLRFQYVKPGVISHNKLQGIIDKKHVIKLHNIFDGSPCTEEIMLADNRVISGGSDNLIDIGPTNDSTNDQCLRLVRVERNHITMGNGQGYRQILMRGAESLIANNILDLSNANPSIRPHGILLGRRGTQKQASTDNRVFNNTCYMRNGGNGARCVVFSGSGVNSVVMNNVIYAPALAPGDAEVVKDDGSGNNFADNVAVSTNPFVTSSPSFVGDYKLGSGASALIDQGTTPSSVLSSDFSAKPDSRVSGSGIDIGAYEDRGAASGLPEAPILLPN